MLGRSKSLGDFYVRDRKPVITFYAISNKK
jgi:hypothetical protein